MEKWFSRGLADWYRRHKRDLPWRHERDPYKIWLSEIILQQTQVAQGLNYYLRFCETFPTVRHLAQASEDQVLKLWQGLGYYSRARNLHHAARTIVTEYRGLFPAEYPEIRALKGVGDYTAAAIASFAFNRPHAVVDGNVYRLLSRLFGIEIAIDSTQGKKQFRDLAEELLDRKNPATHNQAIMEFGSQFCRPVQPDCPNCIFAARCAAWNWKRVQDFPKKSKKTAVRHRFFNYLVIADQSGRILVNKRSENDIWKGLYEFMLIETAQPASEAEVFALARGRKLLGREITLLHTSAEYIHVLTHQRLHARFFVLRQRSRHKSSQASATIHELELLAFSRLTEKFLHDCRLKEMV